MRPARRTRGPRPGSSAAQATGPNRGNSAHQVVPVYAVTAGFLRERGKVATAALGTVYSLLQNGPGCTERRRRPSTSTGTVRPPTAADAHQPAHRPAGVAYRRLGSGQRA